MHLIRRLRIRFHPFRSGVLLWLAALWLAAPWLAVSWVAAASAGVASAAEMKLNDYEVGSYPLGGDFTLTNQDGGKTRLGDLKGKAVLLAFGYTHCPDACPTTLARFKQVKQALGAQGERLQGVMIFIDPARDTPEVVKQYLAYFDPTFIGLTGPPETLEEMAKNYMARYRTRKTDSAAGYFVDHTTFIYLLDPQGKVRYLFQHDVKRPILVEGVQAVLNRKS